MPVLQTLTVLSDGEEELMEQKMGIENGFMNAAAKLPPLDPIAFNLPSVLTPSTGPKRKVGRPITSLKTMNRYEIRTYFLSIAPLLSCLFYSV